MLQRVGLLSVASLVVATLLFGIVLKQVNAHPPGNPAFHDTWARSDQPVADGAVDRTWMWGPEANTEVMVEPYVEAVGGEREVQYFDKSRMEINDPDADRDDLWYVTNGLLAWELISGQMQLGDDEFEIYPPAEVQIAGDPHPDSPTYAQLYPLTFEPPTPEGETLIMRLNPDGSITDDPDLAEHGATTAHYDETREHTVASPFWNFMNDEGLVHVDGQNVQEALFVNPFYATGLPITEAYWVNVPVAGEHIDVLAQCFERRCLTFAPDNDPGWQVEAGNIGQHYQEWRTEMEEMGPIENGFGAPGETDAASFEVSPVQVNPPLGEPAEFGVTVVDDEDSPVAGADVYGRIHDGPHDGTELQPVPATTNPDGVAQLGYVGTEAGTDTVTFYVAGVPVQHTATVTWGDGDASDVIEADVEIYEDIVLTDEAVIATAETEQLLSYAADDWTELHFSGINDQLDSMEPGDVLVLDETPVTDYPILAVKISARIVEDDDDPGLIMATEPGWLDEVIAEGGARVSASIPVSSLDDPEDDERRMSWQDDDMSGDVEWSREFNRQFGESIELDGEMALAGSLDLDYDIRKRRLRLNHFEAAVRTQEHARIELTIDEATDYSSSTTLFESDLPTIKFSIGPVPVVIYNDFYLDAGVDVTSTGAAYAGFEYTGAHGVGIWYDREHSPRYGRIRESDRTHEIMGPDVEGELAADAWVEPKISSSLYGLGGADFGLPVTSEFRADQELNWSIQAKIEARAALVARLPKIIEFDLNLGTAELWSQQLASGNWESVTDKFPCEQIQQIPVSECEALIDVYETANGEQWINQMGWLETFTPCSSWSFVECDHFGGQSHITELEFRAMGLAGNDLSAAELHRLEHLEALYIVGNNGLTAPIPPELGDIQSLRILDLGQNSLTGPIPSELGQLEKLEVLRLDDNQLAGEVPSELGQLVSLRQLLLRDNHLDRTLPRELGQLEKLGGLDISQNSLEGRLPESLTNLGVLTHFYFHDTDMCVPSDTDFVEWLDGIENLSGTGRMCIDPIDPPYFP